MSTNSSDDLASAAKDYLDATEVSSQGVFVGGPLDGAWLAIDTSRQTAIFEYGLEDERGRRCGPVLFDVYKRDDSIMPDAVKTAIEASGRNETRFKYVGRTADPKIAAEWKRQQADPNAEL